MVVGFTCSSDEKVNCLMMPSCSAWSEGGVVRGRTTVGTTVSNRVVSSPTSSSTYTHTHTHTDRTLQLVTSQPALTHPVAWNILRSRGSPDNSPLIIVSEWQVVMAWRRGPEVKVHGSSTKQLNLHVS